MNIQISKVFSFFLLLSCMSVSSFAQQGLPARKTAEVGKGVYAAMGYASNNMGFIVTDEGVAVIDTGTSPEIGKAFLSEIKRITDKPIKYVIFTHYHYDHTTGATAFMEEKTKYVAHENLIKNLNTLKKLERINQRVLGTESETPEIYPDLTYKDTLTLLLGEKEIRLIHVKAETDDATLVYIPEDKVIFIGDLNNPNLGSPVEPEGYPDGLIEAIDIVDGLDINIFVPGHGFMDNTSKKSLHALKEVTVYLMNEVKKCVDEGFDFEETMNSVVMPEKFRNDELLSKTFLTCREPYINRLHKNYTGYYGKDPVRFAPSSKKDISALMAEIAGSNKKLTETAGRLMENEKFQLALELLDIVTTNEPLNAEAHSMKEKAFLGLAGTVRNNWYRMVSYMNAARKERELASSVSKPSN